MKVYRAQIAVACALLAAQTVGAQEGIQLDVRPVPAAIELGQRPFVEVSGTFPDGCTFGNGSLEFALDITAEPRIEAVYTAPDPGACTQAITFARRAFGPLPAETVPEGTEQLPVGFTLQRGDGLRGEGEAVVRIVDDAPPVTPEPGIWWSPRMSGHGVTLETQGGRLFATVYSYASSGRPEWRIAEGPLNGGVFEGRWLRFSGGNCLLCGEPYSPPGENEDFIAMQLAIDGAARAFLHIGPTAGEAIRLQRTHFEASAAVRLAGDTETVPNLAGKWGFVITDASAEIGGIDLRGAIIELRPVEIDRAPAVASYRSPDGFMSVQCSRGENRGPFKGCELNICANICSPPIGLHVPPQDVGVNRLRTEDAPLLLHRLPDSVETTLGGQ